MRATFSLYPWDLDGPHDAARLHERGIESVALAATYHAARVVTPRSSRQRFFSVPNSVSFVPGGPLPLGECSWPEARDWLESVGVGVDAWVVLAHLDGDVLPDVPRVVDAFGTTLAHAPCLRSGEWGGAAEAILEGVLAADPAGLVVEGASWAAAQHGSLHEKSVGADLTVEQWELLSWCCCGACCEAAGIPDLAERVRAHLTGERELDDSTRATVARSRRDAALAFRDRVSAAARAAGIRRLVFHPDAPVDHADADLLLVDAWAGAPDPRELRPVDGIPRGAYVTILGDRTPDWSGLGGADELLVYHAGIASDARLDAALTALKGQQ